MCLGNSEETSEGRRGREAGRRERPSPPGFSLLLAFSTVGSLSSGGLRVPRGCKPGCQEACKLPQLAWQIMGMVSICLYRVMAHSVHPIIKGDTFFGHFLGGCSSSTWKFPGQGSDLSCSCAPTPQIATPDLCHVCDLHRSSWQHWIFHPLSEARDRTCALMDTSQVGNPLRHIGNSSKGIPEPPEGEELHREMRHRSREKGTETG